MNIDDDAFERAKIAYELCNGGHTPSLREAIETYFEAVLKPGQLTVLEPSQTIQPARDYRKEVWIAAISNGDSSGADYANAVLAEFDKTFPKEQP